MSNLPLFTRVADERIAELEAENAKQQELMRAVVDRYGVVYPKGKTGKEAIDAMQAYLEGKG